MRGKAGTIAILCLIALVAVSVWAQTGTSRITGTVTDKTGAVVSGAKVTAINQGTNIPYTTRTSSTGAYSFESMQPGHYKIEVQAEGFKTYVATDNQLTIGQPMTVNIGLEVGAAAQTVQVEAAAEMVQTSSSGNFGNVVDQNAVTELPIINARGRNPLDLVNFQPGVVVGSNAGGGVYVHGARDRAWDYTLDGIDVNETSSGGGNYTPLKVNPDMLAEFRVVTGNASADMGRASGGQVAMVTKSGTNNLHGNAFFFYQTPGLNANSVGNKIVDPPLGRPQFVQKLGGFSIGGPIIKNKTFFFGNFQFLRTLATSKYTSTVYTQQARQGIFRYLIGGQNMPYGPGGTVDAQGNVVAGKNIGTYNIGTMDPAGIGLDPQMQKFIGLTPLPNDYSVGDGLNLAGYSWNSPENHNENNYVVKVDHNFSDKNSVFFRYAWGHQNTMGDTANGGQRPFPDSPNVVDTYRLPRNIAINWRLTPNSRMTNEFVVGVNRFGFNFANPDKNYLQNPPFIPNDITIPLENYAGNARYLTTIQFNDNFSITKGPHTLRFGASMYYARHIDNRGSVGTYDAMPLMYFGTGTNPVTSAFNLPTNIDVDTDRGTLQRTINNLLGRVGAIQQGFVSKNGTWQPGGTWFNFDFRMPEYDFYAQDNWKVKPNLTIDMGLRWEIKMAPYNIHNQLLQPNQAMVVDGTPNDKITWVPGTLWNNQYKNFGPSIGFAWDPFKNGKTSVRGNYRMAYDRINTFVISSSIIQSLPGYTYSLNNLAFGNGGGRLRDCNWPNGTVTCGGATLAPPASLTPDSLRTPEPFSTNWTTTMDPNMVTPKTHMWGFSIQRELGHQMVLELNYLGRHGVNLFGGHDANVHDIFNNGFLQAFNTIKAGGNAESPLINALMAGYFDLDPGQTGSQYLKTWYSTSLKRNNIGTIAKLINEGTTSNGDRLITANGFSPYFFNKYPQFADEVDTLDTKDWSNYHAFEAQLQRRMTNGLQFQVSYTFSKSLDTRSFDPTFTTILTGASQASSSTPFDALNRQYNYSPSDFDRRHALQGNVIYELPFGRGKLIGRNANGILEKLIGGFQVATIFTVQSGRPFTVYSGAYTFNDTVGTPASCDSCSSDMPKVAWRGDPYQAGSAYYLFTPEQKAMFYQPAAGQLSNLGRNFFRLPKTWNIDMAVAKKFKVTEKQELELRLDMQNMTNSVNYGLAYSSGITSSMFGYMTGQTANNPRTMQLVAKYTF